MAAHCEVMETAAKLSLQLEAYKIPDGFEATGNYWEIVARIRDHYTNYKRLLDVLDRCPADGGLTRSGRPSDDCARELLETEARQLAMRVYRTWHSQHNKLEARAEEDKLA
jgi:hypothetical protein